MNLDKDPTGIAILSILAVGALVVFSCCGFYAVMTWANNGGISRSLHAFGETSWGIYCCYGTMCLGMLSGLGVPAYKVVGIIVAKE